MASSFNPNSRTTKFSRHLNAKSPTQIFGETENLFILPPIDYESKKKAFNQPTSILTKFVQNRMKNLIQSTKEDLRRPIKIQMLTSLNYNTKDRKRNKTMEKRYMSNKLFITDYNKIRIIDKYKENKDDNKEKDKDKDKENEDKKDDKENKNENGNESDKASKNNDEDDQTTKSKGDSNNESRKDFKLNTINTLTTLTLDHAIKESRMKFLIPKFRRIRIYQPLISENWKFKNGLRVTIGNEKMNSLPIKNDIEYQYKIINDEFKLLEDNYLFYKTKIIIKDNYYDAFSTMSLSSKINYNKTLEETIGLLYILPQLLLLEFYKLIKNYSGVNIPNPDLFKEKYVFDEVKNLRYNNSLLIKVYNFFNSCYEVYGTLIKEVNDMCLNSNGFINVINCLEKARYNLSYLSTSSQNAIKNYNEDLKYIQKISNDNKKVSSSIDVTEKMSNQFAFKKNDEKQRKLRIETALENKYEREDLYDEIKRRENNEKRNISFLDSKLITGLMKHFTKKVKNEITTQKINKEIDGNYDDDDGIKGKHKVIKINF